MSNKAFAQSLLNWFELKGRKHLPWQQSPTPYSVWVSEIMLQQTQVKTVIPYYERFMAVFPTLEALAKASEDKVLHQWTGLGYYARARNLHKAAKMIIDDWQGDFPTHIDEVIKLPGIGRSTAGAILSFSFQQRHAILDGNVKRVLSRYEGVEGWAGKAEVAAKLWALAETHTPKNDAAKYNQAIMDLGATLCTRTKPICADCPVYSQCFAFQNGLIDKFPAKKTTKSKPIKQTWMLLLESPNGYWVYKRPSEGLWGGLWSLPQFETLDELENWKVPYNCHISHCQKLDPFRHTFTHFHLDIQTLHIQLDELPSTSKLKSGLWYQPGSENVQIGLSAPVKKILEQA